MRLLQGSDVIRQEASVSWPLTLAVKRGMPLAVPHLRAWQSPSEAAGRTVFLLDCSASMLTSGALARAKGLLLPWLRAIRKLNGEVTLIGFGGAEARVRFGPAVPRGWNARWLAPIAGGGGTPLQQGVAAAQQYGRAGTGLGRASRASRTTLVLLTDGRSPEQPSPPSGFDCIDIVLPLQPADQTLQETLRRDMGERQARRLALSWGARCVVQ